MEHDPRWLGPLLVLGAYLLGSVSFALLWAGARGVDLRAVGSGNPGATNVRRALGPAAGRAVLALDAAKGAAPVAVATWLLGSADPWTAGTGVAAVVGHCFPLWHRFAGGRGAATGVGVLLVACWPAGLSALATYALLRRLSGRTSVGSLAGTVVGGVVTAAVLPWRDPRVGMAVAVGAVIVLRHLPNLRRLAKGAEPPS
ncbi:MAG: glycerol-3-phosphate acyltransferase [Sandaracinaceae bacterium]